MKRTNLSMPCHSTDATPIINIYCENRQILYDLLDERFEEINALDGKTHLNYTWQGNVIEISEGLSDGGRGFMFFESIFN